VPASGIGSRRRFNLRDITAAMLVRDMREIGDHVAAARAVVAALTRCWTDDDPEHAGCIVTAAPFGEADTAWFEDWSRMQGALRAERGPGDGRSVHIAVDARVAARRATALLEAALARNA
jgi:hypothetical protein